jgi:prepilin-type N-terminal cleavage/methylation domain-containing protein
MISPIGTRSEKERSIVRRAFCRSASAQYGLTLVEVLTAVVILGIGIISVLRAYGRSIEALEAGQGTINGANLVKEKMIEVEQEFLQTDKFTKTSDAGAFDEPHQDYVWEWDLDATETKNLHALSLKVSRQDDPRTFELRTYVVEKETEEQTQ